MEEEQLNFELLGLGQEKTKITCQVALEGAK